MASGCRRAHGGEVDAHSSGPLSGWAISMSTSAGPVAIAGRPASCAWRSASEHGRARAVVRRLRGSPRRPARDVRAAPRELCPGDHRRLAGLSGRRGGVLVGEPEPQREALIAVRPVQILGLVRELCDVGEAASHVLRFRDAVQPGRIAGLGQPSPLREASRHALAPGWAQQVPVSHGSSPTERPRPPSSPMPS